MSDETTELKLYAKNLSDSINAINAVPEPAGFAMYELTVDEEILLPGLPLGISVLFLTQ